MPSAGVPVAGRWVRGGTTLAIDLGSDRTHSLDLEQPSAQGYSQCDFIDPRVDVQAQRALFSLVRRGGPDGIDALRMLGAVRSGVLRGIYQEDQQVPALATRAEGGNWWELIPRNRDSTVFRSREGRIMVFRRTIAGDRERVAGALLSAWRADLIVDRPVALPTPSGRSCSGPRSATLSGQPPCAVASNVKSGQFRHARKRPDVGNRATFISDLKAIVSDAGFGACRILVEARIHTDVASEPGVEGTGRFRVLVNGTPGPLHFFSIQPPSAVDAKTIDIGKGEALVGGTGITSLQVEVETGYSLSGKSEAGKDVLTLV